MMDTYSANGDGNARINTVLTVQYPIHGSSLAKQILTRTPQAIDPESPLRHDRRSTKETHMTGIQAITAALETTQGYLKWFLGDFTDAELLVRPVPEANHAAWQIGNVIGGDVFFVKAEFPTALLPAMPAGFDELYGSKGVTVDDPARFMTKAQYFKLFDDVRAATIAELKKLSDADLDKPCTSDVKAYAPTLGALFQMASDHTLMHVGQFSVIRRKLGKPVLF